MNEQDALLPDETGRTAKTEFNPRDHGMWRSIVNADGRINHEKWMLAIANGQFVGTCKRCGDWLIPARPDDHHGRRDYEATCRNMAATRAHRGGRDVDIPCGYVILAVNGRTVAGTTSARARKRQG